MDGISLAADITTLSLSPYHWSLSGSLSSLASPPCDSAVAAPGIPIIVVTPPLSPIDELEETCFFSLSPMSTAVASSSPPDPGCLSPNDAYFRPRPLSNSRQTLSFQRLPLKLPIVKIQPAPRGRAESKRLSRSFGPAASSSSQRQADYVLSPRYSPSPRNTSSPPTLLSSPPIVTASSGLTLFTPSRTPSNTNCLTQLFSASPPMKRRSSLPSLDSHLPPPVSTYYSIASPSFDNWSVPQVRHTAIVLMFLVVLLLLLPSAVDLQQHKQTYAIFSRSASTLLDNVAFDEPAVVMGRGITFLKRTVEGVAAPSATASLIV